MGVASYWWRPRHGYCSHSYGTEGRGSDILWQATIVRVNRE